MNILEFRGYSGSVEVDMERGVLRGRILFIADLVTYEAESLPQLAQAFESAVDDYFETCETLGREPMQPASGSFNVRVGSDRHRLAQIRALADDVSMNEVISRSLDCYLGQSREVRVQRIEKHFIALQGSEEKTMLIPGSETASGGVRHVHIGQG